MPNWVNRLKEFFAGSPRAKRGEREARKQRPRPARQERDSFRFAPELFEIRNDVIAELSERGFDWLSHYSAVDPLHDVYGIEVCGIRDRRDAFAIQHILIAMFPDWKPG